MGNEICCQQTTSQDRKQQIFISNLSSNVSQSSKHEKTTDLIHLPQLSQEIQSILKHNRPFEQEFQAQKDSKRKTFGKDFYQGPLDLIGRPVKLGKMYKQNGAFFIGHFSSGKAQGPCFYIMNNGSYFQGDMKQNYADCQNGKFVSKDIQYTGGFRNNQFHGQGSEKFLKQTYTFDGIYQNGKKKSGVMRWGAKPNFYIYEGLFDQNAKFTGKAKFIDPQGRYQGQFLNGQKHGYGVYFYNTQLRYQGCYSHNKKQGEGKLFNNDNTIAYKGLFKNGMPNGKGVATAKNGTQFQTQWCDGIDVRLM